MNREIKLNKYMNKITKKERLREINYDLKILRQDRKDDLMDIRRLMKEKRELQGKNK